MIDEPEENIHAAVWRQVREGMEPVPGALALIVLLAFALTLVGLGFLASPSIGLATLALLVLIIILSAWSQHS